MHIEEGKFYRTRDGRKVGPAKRTFHVGIWDVAGPHSYTHVDDGTYRGNREPGMDLVAEWTNAPASPVRTVTRKEIVPGTYGLVTVYLVGDSVRTEFVRSDGSADELRAAAATLIEIADALTRPSTETKGAGE